MKRKLIAVVLYTPFWLAFGLAGGVILSVVDWLSIQRSFVPFLLLGIVGLVFFLPAIITGWIARDRSALIGGLGVIFTNLLIILIAPLTLPGFNIASPILLTLPTALIGSLGGFVGGKLRQRTVSSTRVEERFKEPKEKPFQSRGVIWIVAATALLTCSLTIVGIISAISFGVLKIDLNLVAAASTPTRLALIVISPTVEPRRSNPASTSIPTPTLTPTPVPPTATPTPTNTPIPASTNTPVPTATTIPTPTPVPIPPGVYVMNLRFEPANLGRGQEATFYASFLNTTGFVLSPRWLVYIYYQFDYSHPIGQTSVAEIPIPVGQSEQRALGAWKPGLGRPCEDHSARVMELVQNQPKPFAKVDGQIFELYFRVC